MTQGLEAGISRVLAGKDGQLIVGGLGAGGNWGQTGKLRHGLQKLDLSGDVPFDMLSMDVIEGGFEIEYTKPLSATTIAAWPILPAQAVALPRDVAVRRPQARRGDPRRHQRHGLRRRQDGHGEGRGDEARPGGLPALAAALLLGLRRDPVEHGGVVHAEQLSGLRRAGARARRGRHLRARGRRSLRPAGVATEHAGYTGSGFVDGIQTVGSGSAVALVTPKAGTYDLQIRYATGRTPAQPAKKMSLYLGDERQQVVLPPWGTGRRGHVHRPCRPARGEHRAEIVYEQGDDGNVNLDHLKVVDPSAGRSRPRTATSPAPTTASRPSTPASAAPATSVGSRTTAPR